MSLKSKKPDNKSSKPSRKIEGFWLSVFAACGLVIGAITLYYLVMLCVILLSDDGIKSYSGAKRELAEKVVDDLKYAIDNKARWAHNFHVEEVRPTTSGEEAQYCRPNESDFSTNPDDPRFYTVIIKTGYVMNPDKETVIVDGCNAFGPYRDSRYGSRSK